MTSVTYLGKGLYSIPDAARIVGVKPFVLRRWIRDFSYAIGEKAYRHAPVVMRPFGSNAPLTFLELIEILFVKLFREEGLSMQYIRRAAEIAADLFETPYPFAVKRFDTDGRRIFATLKADPNLADTNIVLEELDKGQTVFESVIRPFFRKLDYGEAEALKYWPQDREGRVVLDPERAFGQPIDAETGVPTLSLFKAFLAEGGTAKGAELVAEFFRVPRAAVDAAVRYEQSLAAA